MKELYDGLAEILEVEEISREDILADFENWDSLAVLSIMALAGDQYGIMLNNEDIKGLCTVGDLEDLIREKMSE